MTKSTDLITIAELAVARERVRRQHHGYEMGGNFYAARTTRKELARIDSELTTRIDQMIAADVAAPAGK
jgi:hypothetical protein